MPSPVLSIEVLVFSAVLSVEILMNSSVFIVGKDFRGRPQQSSERKYGQGHFL
jgi:hypothetical protein